MTRKSRESLIGLAIAICCAASAARGQVQTQPVSCRPYQVVMLSGATAASVDYNPNTKRTSCLPRALVGFIGWRPRHREATSSRTLALTTRRRRVRLPRCSWRVGERGVGCGALRRRGDVDLVTRTLFDSSSQVLPLADGKRPHFPGYALL